MFCDDCHCALPDQFVLVSSSHDPIERDVLMSSADTAFDDTAFSDQLARLTRQESVAAHFAKRLQVDEQQQQQQQLRQSQQTRDNNNNDIDDKMNGDHDNRVGGSHEAVDTNRRRTPKKERLCETCRFEIQQSIDKQIAIEEERARSYAAYMATLGVGVGVGVASSPLSLSSRRNHVSDEDDDVAEQTAELLARNAAKRGELVAAQRAARDVHAELKSLVQRWLDVERRLSQQSRRMTKALLNVCCSIGFSCFICDFIFLVVSC